MKLPGSGLEEKRSELIPVFFDAGFCRVLVFKKLKIILDGSI
jgi:hypothetical protein